MPTSRRRTSAWPVSAAKRAVEAGPNQVLPLATLVEALHAAGKEKEAREAYRRLEPLARAADRDTPIFRRLDSIVAAWKAQGHWGPTFVEAPTDETIAVTRVDLGTVGPLGWTPSPAPPSRRWSTPTACPGSSTTQRP